MSTTTKPQVINVILMDQGIITGVNSFVANTQDEIKDKVEQAEELFIEIATKHGFEFDRQSDDSEYEQAEDWVSDNQQVCDLTLVWSVNV